MLNTQPLKSLRLTGGQALPDSQAKPDLLKIPTVNANIAINKVGVDNE